MNVIAWVSLCSSIICLFLGVIVYSFNKKSMLNKMFLLAILATFWYSFSTVMMWAAGNVSSANLWNKAGVVWPFFVALTFNFALVFTESKWLKNKLNYLVLYLPATAFCLIDLFTNLINGPPVLQYWGYNDPASGTWVYIISTAWSAIIPILAFVFCFRYYNRAKDSAQRQQRKYVTLGFAIPVVTFITTNMLARSFNIGIPNLGIIATLFFSGFVAYAILKFELFTFDAALAAENILSAIPDSIILADTNAKMLKVNDRLVNFIGCSAEELTGQPIQRLCFENEEINCENILNELTEKGIVRNHELMLATKSGNKKHVLFSGSTIKSKTGRTIGLACIIHDITEHKNIGERLLKAERLASIGELAGQIGHDLRNPLAGIKNSVYILEKKGERLTETERKQILGTLDNAVEDANRIVTSLIDYSSDFVLELKECSPKLLVLNALSKIKIPDRINIQNAVMEDTKIFIDGSRVESVLASIVKNTMEAIVEKGTIKIWSIQKESTTEISVTDSGGGGIPQKVLPKIFAPLVTTKAKGMGMSLAICKRIAEAHGGKITVETKMGIGTTVTIVLPSNLSKNEYAHTSDFYVDLNQKVPLPSTRENKP